MRASGPVEPQDPLGAIAREQLRVELQPLVSFGTSHVRFDTVDYSRDPRLVGRRVEVVVSQRRVRGCALDTGEGACDHERSFARHRTVTALEHARALRELRGAPAETEVEVRSLARYDRLIPA